MIGVAGCGRMGLPMLEALLNNGAEASGFDIAHMLHPHVTQNAEAFAAGLSTLISVVRDEAQTEEVLFSAQGFVTRAPHLSRILICSTLSPRFTRALRARIPGHIALIDAPMSGARIAAQDARLTFMLGGSDIDLDDVEPMLLTMGETLHRLGPFGAGMQAKVLNNLLAASHTAMTRLVLDWSTHSGLDEKALLRVIETSSGQNWFASGYNDIDFARDGFNADNSIGILFKDVAAALDAAPHDAGTVLPQTVMNTLRNLKPRS